MAQVEFLKPPEVFEKMRAYHHRLELSVHGENVGYADFEYFSNPFPFYYISFVFVRPKARNQRFGREIMTTINKFLVDKRKAGLLVCTIEAEDATAGMYERYGWQPVPGKPEWYTYNLPKQLNAGRLEQAIYQVDETYRPTEKLSAA